MYNILQKKSDVLNGNRRGGEKRFYNQNNGKHYHNKYSDSDEENDYEVDLIVIGGGSGGLSVAKEAASLGAKVVLFDYVKPSPHGSMWGIGGTCVNVGCVPKKMMHFSSLLGPLLKYDSKSYGWSINDESISNKSNSITNNWQALVENIQNHIRMLNFQYRVGLRSKQVRYINALAKFVGPNKISYKLKNMDKNITAKTIVIATGGRPMIPSIPGAELPSILL